MEGERAARAVSRRAAGLLLAVALLLVRAEAAESEAGPNGHRLIRVPAGTYALGEEGHALNPAHRAVLGQMPERGALGGVEGGRELFVRFGRSGYVIQYVVRQGDVIILRIFHSREER